MREKLITLRKFWDDRVSRNNVISLTAVYQLAPLVRVEGIEPSSHAWEARILPMNYTRA